MSQPSDDHDSEQRSLADDPAATLARAVYTVVFIVITRADVGVLVLVIVQLADFRLK